MDIGLKIAEVAAKYIGKTEKPGNSGFNDAEFEKKMITVGWLKGQAWCAYFCELVWKEVYSAIKPGFIADLNKLFAAGALQTLNNFKAAGYPVSKEPVPGALAIYQHGKGWQGHACIVEKVSANKKDFGTIEGNTNDAGGREGYIVARKTRYALFDTNYASGLNLIGFIHPKYFTDEELHKIA